MATKQSTVDLIIEQAAGAGYVMAKKMFGEYALYCDGKLVGLICDDQLFIKPTAEGRAYLGSVTELAAYPGAKPSFLIGGEAWEDAEWLSGLIRITAAAMPAPAPRKSTVRAPRAQ